MKTTENKKIIDLIKEYSQFTTAIKEMELARQTIKTSLKMIMEDLDVKALGAGDYVLIISDRVRIDLDKEAVQKIMGDKYEECIKKSEYQIFEVKKAFK